MFLKPVHLTFALGWNSEQGKGNCIWAKVNLSGWRSLGFEEKGTQSCQSGVMVKESRDTGPADSHGNFNAS